MKRLFAILFIAVSVFSLSSCEEEEGSMALLMSKGWEFYNVKTTLAGQSVEVDVSDFEELYGTVFSFNEGGIYIATQGEIEEEGTYVFDEENLTLQLDGGDVYSVNITSSKMEWSVGESSILGEIKVILEFK